MDLSFLYIVGPTTLYGKSHISPAMLLLGISNLLYAHLDKNVISNTFNQFWLKLHQTILAVQCYL